MKYDIASKRLVELGGRSILRELVKIDISDFELISELPQQTVSIRSSDFPLLVTDQDGNEMIVLLEFQTEWKKDMPLRVGEYLIRFLRKYHLPVIPVVLLFKKHGGATDRYESEFLSVKYHLVRVWEIDGKELLKMDDLFLMPMVAITKSDRDDILEAERKIYESGIDIGEKADLLSILTIFAGLDNNKLAEELFTRRRDIMIESFAYELFKQEAFKEGIEEGIEKGVIKASKEMIMEALEERFDIISVGVVDKVDEIGNAMILKGLRRQAIRCKSLEDFEEILERAM